MGGTWASYIYKCVGVAGNLDNLFEELCYGISPKESIVNTYYKVIIKSPETRRACESV